MSKDPDKIAAIEKAIAKKYGEEAIQNPRSSWDEAKEKKYLDQMREHYTKHDKNRQASEKVDINGIKVSKKLLNRESLRYCPVCDSSPHTVLDDVCLTKFECCNQCYIQYVEGREERWHEGWRPDENYQRSSQTDNS